MWSGLSSKNSSSLLPDLEGLLFHSRDLMEVRESEGCPQVNDLGPLHLERIVLRVAGDPMLDDGSGLIRSIREDQRY